MNTHEHRSPDEIEREIAHTREHIDRTIDVLTERLSPSGLLDQALHKARDTGGEFTLNLGRTIRDNPVPAALLGLGLGWLMVADRRRKGGENGHGYGYGGGFERDYEPHLASSDGGDESYRARVTGEPGDLGRGRGVDVPDDWSAAYEAQPHDEIDATGGASPSAGDRVKDRAQRSFAEGQAQAASLRSSLADSKQRGTDRAHGAADRAREQADRARASARSGAERVRERGRESAERMRDTRERMSERLHEGRRNLSDRSSEAMAHARDYGSAASERASEMYRRSGSAVRSAGWRAREAAGSTGQFAREHPLAVGLVIAAAGAVIAGLTPRSRREDEIMGEHSDALKGAARDAAQAEANRLREAASAAVQTGREEARRSGLTPDDVAKAADEKVAAGIGAATAAAQAGVDHATESGAAPREEPRDGQRKDPSRRPAEDVVGTETLDKIKPAPTADKPESKTEPAGLGGVSGIDTPSVGSDRR